MTAQELFKHVMRDLVGPGLRELGFSGGYTRGFRIAHGDYAGYVETQKSVGSTRTEVWFWVHLMACHEPTNAVYWSQELHWLIPGGRAVGGWAIKVDSPPEPVAESVLSGFRRYGWPAMQAAMDSPASPQTPAPTGHARFPVPTTTTWMTGRLISARSLGCSVQPASQQINGSPCLRARAPPGGLTDCA
jgi:hypothetical protein